jgi:chemotaxis family two-component system sensor kinase Cph1
LPSVMGDSSELAAVLRHLLDNALKFQGAEAPRIHVSVRRLGDQWEFSVRDNGPGIETLYHARIFLPFKRLHGRNYAGNGLGLALCKKVVERHRGKIWAASEPASGVAIMFTLQAAD